jgi:hypothetical protein
MEKQIECQEKNHHESNASLSRGNLSESGRDVGENLIAETLACPSSKKVTVNTGGTLIG